MIHALHSMTGNLAPYVDAKEVAELARFDDLIPRLRAAFSNADQLPVRHHHCFDHPNGRNTLLLMPCWNDRHLGLKVVIVAPENAQAGLPSVSSTYSLFDKITGRTLAQFDGNAITSRRTAAASALAASFLARPNSTRMLLAGTGRVASLLPSAYRTVLPIKQVDVFNRSLGRGLDLVDQLRADGFEASICKDLRASMEAADVISCATLANEIVVHGKWLHPGQFVDLIGSFQPHSREADEIAIERSKVVVDTSCALTEAGDLVIPTSCGSWHAGRLEATLLELCKGRHPGRTQAEELWLFKSVGTALEDLTTAEAIYENQPQTPTTC